MGAKLIAGRTARRRPMRAIAPILGVALIAAACSSNSSSSSSGDSSSEPAPAATTSQSASSQPASSGSPAAKDMDTMTMDELYQAAMKNGEKELVTYGTSSPGDLKAYTAVFDKKFPGIKIVHTKQQGEEAASKMVSEAKAGVYDVDVLNVEQNTLYAIAQEGLLAKYDPPEAAGFDDRLKNPYFTGFRIQFKPMAYNTKVISKDEAPKTYEDLLDPKWKGKICEEATDVSVFADRLQDLGEQAGVDYWKKLYNNGLRFVSGQTALTNDVESGECPIAFSVNIHGIAEDASKGAPVAWVKTDPVYANYGGLGIAAKAPHPYLARLWVNYLLSEDGQQAVADAWRLPANPKVQPREPELQNGNYKIVLAGDEVMKNFTHYNNLFYETTGRPVVGQ